MSQPNRTRVHASFHYIWARRFRACGAGFLCVTLHAEERVGFFTRTLLRISSAPPVEKTYCCFVLPSPHGKLTDTRQPWPET